MPVFSFQALDEQGNEVKDTIEAPSKDEAKQQIRQRRLKLMEIKEAKGGKAKSGERKKGGIHLGGVAFKDKALFTKQLATLQDAGLPIVRSLKILEGQMRPGLFKEILFEVGEDVNTGTSFSEALEKHPKAFDRLYVNLVKAGEMGGVLDEILNRLSEFMDKAQKLKKKIIGALTYPAVVIFIAGVILCGIMLFIIPSFEKMFKGMGIELPPLTLVVIGISRFMANNWYVFPALPVLVFIAMAVVRNNPKLKYGWDYFVLHVPIFGTIMNKSTLSRFCRTFGTLIASGVAILEALAITRDAIGNTVVVSALGKVYDSIKEGDNIADPLAETNICDDMVTNMIAVGEETGELDKMLIKVSDTYDDDVDIAVDALTSLIEPLMIVFLGASVGTIVIALFLPMIKLIEGAGQG